MDRRTFLASGIATGAGALSLSQDKPQPGSKGSFKLLYAPHFGQFRHHAGQNPIDQLKFMADQGFRAMEDNGMMGQFEVVA